MSVVPSIVDSPRLFEQSYPLPVYQAAEAEGPTDQRMSNAFTNIVAEVVERNLLRPLAEIPGLVAQVSKGPLDVETIGKVNAVLQGFPSFVQALSERKLGAPLPKGDQQRFAARAGGLLLIKGPFFMCGGAPLSGLLVGYLMRTQKMGKEDAAKFIKDANKGSLIDAIATKAIPLVYRAIAAMEERGRLAKESIRVSEERSRVAVQRSRESDAETAEIQRRIECVHFVRRKMEEKGILPTTQVSVPASS
jgi:hypothetical protein